MAGAWRYLDEDISGYITIREYDLASAKILQSFKAWAEEHFGSVKLAFKAIDADGNGTVSFQELKRISKSLKWVGDVKILFNCLDVDGKRDLKGENAGKRSLSLNEVAFLDEWRADQQHLREEAFGPSIGQIFASEVVYYGPTRATTSPSCEADYKGRASQRGSLMMRERARSSSLTRTSRAGSLVRDASLMQDLPFQREPSLAG